ncbi:MAG: RagB/SusD family nutrient uptake outer membrane protein, partial [Butyricimonas sp.]|nr:RagB/SusD family nutrient uptake outer membrane protein [Butyricimonas sp.]
PLKLVSAVNEEIGGPRETVEKVYERILEDLNASARLFEKYEVVIGNYRINLPAVKVLLSRVYLYMEQWSDAAQAATEAIRLGKGLSDLTSLEDGDFAGMNSYTMNETLWIFGSSIASFSSAFTFSSDLLSLYTANDKRMGMYIIEDYAAGGKFRGYIYNKYGVEGEPRQCLRLSEAYLNRAEAYAQMPDKSAEALSDLNELRKKRIEGYEDVNITDPVALLDTIRKERRLELCFEGHRWFDLRRYGMPEIKHVYQESETAPKMVYTLKEKDRMYTLPIPPSVMEKNRQLVQNVSDSEPLRQGVVE